MMPLHRVCDKVAITDIAVLKGEAEGEADMAFIPSTVT
jgi:hypothetical protein